jgi:long-subunit acyl-CoA synthetase (AMP-forming)
MPEAAAKARDAAGRSALEASLAEHLKVVNAQLDPHEQMECLVVTVDPWSVENDILTPTMKVKRNRIEDLFAQKLRTMGRIGAQESGLDLRGWPRRRSGDSGASQTQLA